MYYEIRVIFKQDFEGFILKQSFLKLICECFFKSAITPEGILDQNILRLWETDLCRVIEIFGFSTFRVFPSLVWKSWAQFALSFLYNPNTFDKEKVILFQLKPFIEDDPPQIDLYREDLGGKKSVECKAYNWSQVKTYDQQNTNSVLNVKFKLLSSLQMFLLFYFQLKKKFNPLLW